MAEANRRDPASLFYRCLMLGCVTGLSLGAILMSMSDTPRLLFLPALYLGLVGMLCAAPVWLVVLLHRFLRRGSDHGDE